MTRNGGQATNCCQMFYLMCKVPSLSIEIIEHYKRLTLSLQERIGKLHVVNDPVHEERVVVHMET